MNYDRNQAIAILENLQEATGEYKRKRILAIRSVAEKARENEVARRWIEKVLDTTEQVDPSVSIDIFRSYYLDDTRPSAKQLSEKFYMNKRTVFWQINRALNNMLTVAFGIYGTFLTDSERLEEIIMKELEKNFATYYGMGMDGTTAAFFAGYGEEIKQRLQAEWISEMKPIVSALLDREDIQNEIALYRQTAKEELHKASKEIQESMEKATERAIEKALNIEL